MAAKLQKTVTELFRILLTFCLLTGKIFTSAERKLRMVNLVYRHGDRSQIGTYVNDVNMKYWSQGRGQLTQVGIRQEYKLGLFLKNRYMVSNTLLNSTYIKNQVYCRSTDSDRTIMSAQAQLNGLYPPHGRQEWRPNLDWQPIPVHVVPNEIDFLLRRDSHCPEYDRIYKQSLSDKEHKEFEASHKELLARLGPPMTGENRSLTIREGARLFDTLFCQRTHNMTLPKWVAQGDMEKLSKINEFFSYWYYRLEEQARLKGGPMIGDFVKHMKAHLNNETGTRKAYIYSAHDTTLMALLVALKIYDRVVPAYSSAVMVELYTDEEGKDPTVQIQYRFGQSDTAKQLVLKGCPPDCPFDKFVYLTKDMVPEDIKAACGSKNQTCVKTIVYKSFLLSFAITLGIVIILSLCLCWCWCRRRRTISRAAHVKFDDGLLKNASLLGNQDYDSD